jgi:hypothetical protein
MEHCTLQVARRTPAVHELERHGGPYHMVEALLVAAKGTLARVQPVMIQTHSPLPRYPHLQMQGGEEAQRGASHARRAGRVPSLFR